MVDVDVIHENISRNIIFERICEYWNIFSSSIYEISGEELKFVVFQIVNYPKSVIYNFDEFQLKILKILLSVLFINIFLIFVLWNVYKDRIYDRFVKPASSCIIEELKKSVSQLKLPRGHSPRI